MANRKRNHAGTQTDIVTEDNAECNVHKFLQDPCKSESPESVAELLTKCEKCNINHDVKSRYICLCRKAYCQSCRDKLVKYIYDHQQTLSHDMADVHAQGGGLDGTDDCAVCRLEKGW